MGRCSIDDLLCDNILCFCRGYCWLEYRNIIAPTPLLQANFQQIIKKHNKFYIKL